MAKSIKVRYEYDGEQYEADTWQQAIEHTGVSQHAVREALKKVANPCEYPFYNEIRVDNLVFFPERIIRHGSKPVLKYRVGKGRFKTAVTVAELCRETGVHPNSVKDRLNRNENHFVITKRSGDKVDIKAA